MEPLDDPAAADAERCEHRVGIRRVANYFRAATLDQPARPVKQPGWVSRVPNQFNPPAKWQSAEGGFGAVDNAYSMAPYLVMPGRGARDQGPLAEGALLERRALEPLHADLRLRAPPVSLNRKQTRLERDGSFRIVIAHRDPGVPNWIDAEGRPRASCSGASSCPRASRDAGGQVVPLASLRVR